MMNLDLLSIMLASAAPLQIVSAPASLDAGTVDIAYTPTDAIVVTGGSGVYIFSASGLPTGMSIASDSGVISGTPTETVSEQAVSVRVRDSSPAVAAVEIAYSLTIGE